MFRMSCDACKENVALLLRSFLYLRHRCSRKVMGCGRLSIYLWSVVWLEKEVLCQKWAFLSCNSAYYMYACSPVIRVNKENKNFGIGTHRSLTSYFSSGLSSVVLLTLSLYYLVLYGKVGRSSYWELASVKKRTLSLKPFHQGTSPFWNVLFTRGFSCWTTVKLCSISGLPNAFEMLIDCPCKIFI